MVHGLKKNMPNKLMDLKEKIMLKKRNLIETIFDYLKNKMNLEHTRHRSPINAFVHILSTLVAYSLKQNKPSIIFDFYSSFNNLLIPNYQLPYSNGISLHDIPVLNSYSYRGKICNCLPYWGNLTSASPPVLSVLLILQTCFRLLDIFFLIS